MEALKDVLLDLAGMVMLASIVGLLFTSHEWLLAPAIGCAVLCVFLTAGEIEQEGDQSYGQDPGSS